MPAGHRSRKNSGADKEKSMILWFATSNTHKKAELAAILPGHTLKIPKDAGIDFDPEETGNTFTENALIKARCLYRLVREPVIADDSGLCIDALDGRPGIFSARYGGAHINAAERNALLLEELGDAPNRKARFVCAMVLLLGIDRFFIAQETLEGEIVCGHGSARGSGGFGYDPIFYLPEKQHTVAELPEEEKNRLSHRGKAGRVIAKILAGD
jgi:XTP/dITP diphosphohydrolase